jgi:holliday junction DNA helicase RuvB
MREDGIVSASLREEERQFEATLRPNRLADFAGQSKVKENLAIAIEAARRRGEAMDHVLLYGPPGLGKTTLAGIIAAELGVGMQQTSRRSLTWSGASATSRNARCFSSTKFIGCSRMWKR